MSSSLIAPVARVDKVTRHPNADNLDILEVLGWQVVTQKDTYKPGSKVVYFPPDTILPQDLSDYIGVTKYLHNGRIKPTRLRGEPSFGLVLPASQEWEVGENVASYFNVTKYEPPVRPNRRGGGGDDNIDRLPGSGLFPQYTGVENLRHFPNLISLDEMVVVTEKLHGTNSRIGKIEGEWWAGSHRLRRGRSDNLYWSPRRKVESLVEYLSSYHKQVIVYGEILGGDIQSLDYGYPNYTGYHAFDILVDGRYLDYSSFLTLCDTYKVPIAPILWAGKGFDLTGAKLFASGSTTLPAAHLKEGIVVRPIIERHDPKVGRVILKYVSNEFLLAKKTDFTEV